MLHYKHFIWPVYILSFCLLFFEVGFQYPVSCQIPDLYSFWIYKSQHRN